MADSRFEGIFAATLTPFTDDGVVVDEEAIHALVDRLVAAGVAGLVPCGSTGEFPHLTTAERRRVVEVFIGAAAGRVPVIAHTGALTTAETIALSRHAEEAGAAAVMVVPPFYDPPSWRELVAHLQAVSDSVGVPLVLYNIPSVTGLQLDPGRIAELARTAGIRYVKDTSGSVKALIEMVERYGDTYTTFNGWDTITLPGFFAGTRASIWGAVNLVPELCVELYTKAVVEADVPGAHRVWDRLWPILDFAESVPYVPALRAGCALRGYRVGPPRRPFLPLAQEDVQRLRAVLADAEVDLAD